MGNKQVRQQRVDRASVASVARQVAALDDMTVGELAAVHLEVCGAPTRSRNRGYLRKCLAWRIQEQAEGGLSARALDRIEQLAPLAPARWRTSPPSQAAAETPAPIPPPVRDPRVPPVGTSFSRVYEGVTHEVTVLPDGFGYRGARHRSLSGIARQITGRSWNGFVFFFGRGDASGPEAGDA